MSSKNPKIDIQVFEECANSWENMHLGLFYAKIPLLMENNTIDKLIEKFEYPIVNDSYKLDKGKLTSLLASQNLLANKFNSFDFFIIWNSLGNIFRAFKEGFAKEKDFKSHMEKTLGANYDGCKELVYLLRNFFSHNIDENFRIHSDDISANKDKTLKINLKLNSKEINLSGPEIIIDIKLDFLKINAGDKLSDFIRFDEIFLFADFCARLSLDYSHGLIDKILGKNPARA